MVHVTYTHIPWARIWLHGYTQLDERLRNVVCILVAMYSTKVLLQWKKYSEQSDWKKEKKKLLLKRGSCLCSPIKTTELWGPCCQISQDSAVYWAWEWKGDFWEFFDTQALRDRIGLWFGWEVTFIMRVISRNLNHLYMKAWLFEKNTTTSTACIWAWDRVLQLWVYFGCGQQKGGEKEVVGAEFYLVRTLWMRLTGNKNVLA